jgi:putative chitinase
MELSAQQIAQALDCPLPRAAAWAQALSQAMQQFDITELRHVAAFLAQVGHESGRLGVLEENLNYSAIGLSKTWPKRYAECDANGKPMPGVPNALANRLHRNPEAIANNVYANRMGNGDEASGDGWRYRGKGLIQLTGRENHRICGEELDLPLEEQPELLLQPEYAALSAAWFWATHNLNAMADDDDVTNETKIINGGVNGLEDRIALYGAAKDMLGVA